MLLAWTTEKPTVTAFYWYWLKGASWTMPVVAQVECGQVRFAGYDRYQLVDGLPGEWAGPLEPPE